MTVFDRAFTREQEGPDKPSLARDEIEGPEG